MKAHISCLRYITLWEYHKHKMYLVIVNYFKGHITT